MLAAISGWHYAIPGTPIEKLRLHGSAFLVAGAVAIAVVIVGSVKDIPVYGPVKNEGIIRPCCFRAQKDPRRR